MSTASELPLAQRPENRVKLVVNGMEYGGWKSVRITPGIERQARDFELTVTDRWPGFDAARRVQPGDACEVYIGDDLVLTGAIDATPIRYDSRRISVGVKGRSKTADLVDCCPVDVYELIGESAGSWDDVKPLHGEGQGRAVKPSGRAVGQWRNQKLEAIAADLAAPYGVRVLAEIDTGEPIKDHQVQIGETVFESIDRMMRLRHVLSTDNEYGDLVFIEVGSGGTAVDALETGPNGNIKSGNAPLDYKGVFSEYIVKGQRAGDDSTYGRASAEVEGRSVDDEDEDVGQGGSGDGPVESGRAVDARATRRRVLVIKQSGQADESTAQDRADYERAHRAAKALQTDYRIVGWRQSNGALWKQNMLVQVRDPLVGFDTEMVIAEIIYTISNEDALVADIKVGPPDGYRPKAGVLKSKNRQKGGGSDWSDVKDIR